MSYSVEIVFGKDEIEKYNRGIVFTAYEKAINLKKYVFETFEERNAFYKGIGEGVGWLDCKVIKETEITTKNKSEEEVKFDYWGFIQKYYPKYYSCNNVLLSDILTRKMDNEELELKDEEYIKNWNIREELMNIDKELLSLAFENFFNEIYPPE